MGRYIRSCLSWSCGFLSPKSGKYYTTFYNSHYAYTLPEGVKAYTADYVFGRVTLKPVDGNVLPKDKAVVLCSSEHSAISMAISDKNSGINTGIMEVDEDVNVSIYSLQGIRLARLQKGINIVNGKKVIVK